MENPTRRRVLTAGLSGAVATALIGSRVSATTPTEPPTTDDTPETTAAPTLPTDADKALLGFAQGAELAARDLYAAAIEAGAADEVFEAARINHQAAADAISALIGGAAPQAANEDIVGSLVDSFATDDTTAVATAGAQLENTLVATHTELVGQLQNLDGISRVSATLVAEAQMAAVMTDLAGQGTDLAAMFDNSATALTPTEG